MPFNREERGERKEKIFVHLACFAVWFFGGFMPYEMIPAETRGRVGLVTLNRPQAMNALNNHLMRELMDALEAFDKKDRVGAMVITGNEKAFAAGADIKEMADKSIQQMMDQDHVA